MPRNKSRNLSHGNEWVVLLHGLGRTALSMKRLEWALTKAGYNVVNKSYSSRRQDIKHLSGDFLKSLLDETVPRECDRVHFVTHSLGGLIVREYLSQYPLANLGRVVMLGPPNQGSALVDILRRFPAGRWILGPSGYDLGTSPSDAPQRLGPVKFPLGVIAGDFSFNPLLSWAFD